MAEGKPEDPTGEPPEDPQADTAIPEAAESAARGKNLTVAPSPPQPFRMGEFHGPGRKIDSLGLGGYIIEMLPFFTSSEIARLLNEFLKGEGSRETVTRKTVTAWVAAQGEKIQAAVKKRQSEYLEAEVWEWERQGIKIREEAQQILDVLLKPELTKERIAALTPKERKDLMAIIKQKVLIQESGERFMGINTPKGKRFNIDVNVQVDVIDRMRDIVGEEFKPEDAVDVPYEELPPADLEKPGAGTENRKPKTKNQKRECGNPNVKT